MFELIDDATLRHLQKAADDLERARDEKSGEVAQLAQQVAHAREDDLNREAAALNAGKKPPKATEPEIKERLEDARREYEVLDRRAALARGDVGKYISENLAELHQKHLHARAEAAQELASLAAPLSAALSRYYQIGDDVKTLKRYQPAEEASTAPAERLTNIFVGVPQTTQNAYGDDRIAGLHRGELEGVLAALANLASRLEQPGEEEGAA